MNTEEITRLTMKEIPILFSTPMVQAILQGRKTQTRRIIDKDLSVHLINPCEGVISFFQGAWGCPDCGAFHFDNSLKCRFGQPGDKIWVRETFCPYNDGSNNYWHKATDSGPARDSGFFTHWRPSIHMPKAAARIWLEVESVGVERLQDISEEDALAEGIKVGLTDGVIRWYHDYLRPNGYPREHEYDESPESPYTAKGSYATLWERINGPGSWEQNPWVWVIKFRPA